MPPEKSELLYTPEAAAFFAGAPWALPLWEEAAGAILRSCTNSRRTHLDGKFSACLCQKTLKYIQYSCAFLASAVKKFARQSAHFGYWYSF